MLKILKDCILSGVQVHAGEIYPAADFREQDIQIVSGLGFAERFTPDEKPEEPEPEDAVPEEPEDFAVSPVKQKKKRRK